LKSHGFAEQIFDFAGEIRDFICPVLESVRPYAEPDDEALDHEYDGSCLGFDAVISSMTAIIWLLCVPSGAKTSR